MSQLQKYLFSIVAFLLIVVISFDASLFMAINYTPNQLKVRYTTLQDTKIPESLNDVSIVFITDLQYGTYQTDERTKRVFEQIQALNPDILVFGGDLYDSNATISNQSNEKLIQYFNSIEAPMGKYAIWGEKDWSDDTHKEAVKKVYHYSQMELLHNTNVRISGKDKKSIRLIGLTSTNNISQALDGLSSKTYNLFVTHKPDNFLSQSLANHSISYGIAGHSHGTQITLPFLGAYKTIQGASQINKENHKTLSFPYTINAGLGCTKVDMRYNATPEIDVFVLKH